MPTLHSSARLLLLLLLGSALLGVHTSPSPPTADEIQEHLRSRVEALQVEAPSAHTVGSERLHTGPTVARYFQQTAFALAWTAPQGPTARVDTLLALLRAADRDGLRPVDYHVSALSALHQQLQAQAEAGRPLDPRRLVDLELLCTDAFVLYGSHLLTGRVAPTALVPTWTPEGRQADLVQHLQRGLTETSLRSALAALRPPQPEYAALRQALARYQSLAATGGWASLPDGPNLEQGAHNPRVSALRRRLRRTNDLTTPPPTDSLAFDAALHTAVTRFQERHGLAVDGVVGPATRRALNVSVEARIQQIETNLERWRWLPADLGSPHVRVNIAGFELRVVENGTDALRMRVVAGRPARKTPVFSNQLSYLVFNPYWYVPQSIAVKDLLPDFQKNPDRVSALGYEVFRGWGADARRVDPNSISWTSLSAASFPYRLRQQPGPQNALGQVKFMFPNAYDIYLHDTPSRHLFNQAQRGFSSGCIRVEAPLALAAYLLQHNDGWTPERIRTAIDGNTEQTVMLATKVPVHLLYWTAWVEKTGTVHFRTDVYDRDPAVRAALTQPLE